MSIDNTDLKLLWGRSGNRCAICKIELSEDASKATKAFPLGEQAHIVAEKEDGPRGKSILVLKQRNSYSNLILLCPTDHKRVDKNVIDFPIEKLHLIKTDHEQWVRQKLSTNIDVKKEVDNLIYADIIDTVVGTLDLSNWEIWSGNALSSNAYWPDKLYGKSFNLIQKMLKTNWPGTFEELERAIKSVIFCFHGSLETFMEHSERRENPKEGYYAHKFYKDTYGKNSRLKEWEEWSEKYYDWIHLLAKSLNWFEDTVRKYINPSFYAIEGKFITVEGPFYDLSFHALLYEFTNEEKKDLPASLEKKLKHALR